MEDDDILVFLDSVKIFLRWLKEIGRGKGKERVVDNGVEELDVLIRLGDMLKKFEVLRLCVELNEVV